MMSTGKRSPYRSFRFGRMMSLSSTRPSLSLNTIASLLRLLRSASSSVGLQADIPKANPGSLMWLSTGRPFPNASCTGFDDYKYGLESDLPAYAGKLHRDSITTSYNQRIVNYAWGTVGFFSIFEQR